MTIPAKTSDPTLVPAKDSDRCNIRGFELLRELSLNLHWSWDHSSDILWERLSPELWELTQNPWAVFQTVSREKLEELLAEPTFHDLARQLVDTNRKNEKLTGWFGEKYKNSPLKSIAYFSMEYMLSEALPIYSGGLGNVAGDQLKAASDLGVPVYAIGLLYQQGYFRQVINNEGAQQALYPFNDPGQLPITPLRKSDGEWLRIEILFPGHSIWIRTWQVQVGRVKLFLLDSNDAANFPAFRGICSELYGGDVELRLRQEIMLGIGGWRLLEALNISPEVCHLNEGHAAFVILERAYSFMKSHSVPFEQALEITRAGNLFTTHTAVPAGFDRFPPELIAKYLDFYAKNRLKISIKDLLALGQENPDNPHELFNMAFLSMRGCAFANAVSGLHEAVSKRLFGPLFPRMPEEEIPIGHVTNGIHVPSWESIEADALWKNSCGKDRWHQETSALCNKIYALPDKELWEMRTKSRQRLIDFARKRKVFEFSIAGATYEEISGADKIFNPAALTLGFARRFATYKRPNLLLHNPERLIAILTNPKRPVQLLLAGKAHPADLQGQDLIRQWSNFTKRPEVQGHIAYLSDYDVQLAQKLVQGVDLWINTPLRPWEACGTSGMKVLVNGGLNLSIPDGWWAEAYSPQVGWAIGTGENEDADENKRDAEDADRLYSILENEVIPTFYERNHDDIPEGWVKLMRASMADLTALFSSNRSVREYTEKYYLPAAELYTKRSSQKTSWQKDFKEQWAQVKFGEVKVETVNDLYRFSVELSLHELDPKTIKVELYANGASGTAPLCYTMQKENTVATDTRHLYVAEIPALHPTDFYTPRAVPCPSERFATHLELPYVLWQR